MPGSGQTIAGGGPKAAVRAWSLKGADRARSSANLRLEVVEAEPIGEEIAVQAGPLAVYKNRPELEGLAIAVQSSTGDR